MPRQLATGNYLELADQPRRRTPRLFEPLEQHATLMTFAEITSDSRETSSEIFRRYTAKFDALGDFASRNPERKRKCLEIQILPPDGFVKPSFSQETELSISSQKPKSEQRLGFIQTSPSSQPEFKIGDTVECLEAGDWASGHAFFYVKQYGQIGKILAIGNTCGEPSAHIEGCEGYHPLRALRHVETEPQAENGWILVDKTPRWKHKDFGAVHKNIDGSFFGSRSGYNNATPSWHELKSTIEKASAK